MAGVVFLGEMSIEFVVLKLGLYLWSRKRFVCSGKQISIFEM